jgi:hypothetical protein
MGYKIITKLGMECMRLNVIYVMHNMLKNIYEFVDKKSLETCWEFGVNILRICWHILWHTNIFFFLKFKYSTCPPFSPKLKRNWASLVHVASLHWLHVNWNPNYAPHHFQLRLIARLYSSCYMFHNLKAWKKILNGPLDSTLWLVNDPFK